MPSTNKSFHKAKAQKNDEFYTRLEDIEDFHLIKMVEYDSNENFKRKECFTNYGKKLSVKIDGKREE